MFRDFGPLGRRNAGTDFELKTQAIPVAVQNEFMQFWVVSLAYWRTSWTHFELQQEFHDGSKTVTGVCHGEEDRKASDVC